VSPRALGLTLALGLLGAVSLAAVVRLSGDPSSAPRRAATAPRFPAGPGLAIAERSCLVCHSAMLVTQQRKDSTGWEKTLRQMEAWGVTVSAEERDTLLVYLRGNFGPREPGNRGAAPAGR
jgi:mono/diheme cytochrome c family protein